MRIDSGDSINSNISMNSNSPVVSDAFIKSTGVGDFDKVKRAQPNTKAISQIKEYDIGIMPVSERVVIEAIQKANKAISGGNRRFEFSIHEKTNEIVVKVFDSQTDELIREIPNEKVLDMVAKICEMAGILVDERR